MGRKFLYSLLALLLLVVPAALFVCFWPSPYGLTPTSFESVQVGMTLAEATAILGPPQNVLDLNAKANYPIKRLASWYGEYSFAQVTLDSQDRVVDCHSSFPTLWHRFMRRLGLHIQS